MTWTLIGEAASPWSEKARWALDHHRLAYAYREHYPLIGELSLRLRARRLKGRVSTPMLLTAEGPLIDSFHIARYADAHGSAPTLFPAEHAEEIAAWNARSEAALGAARVRYLDRLANDRAAKLEQQPPAFPGFVRQLSVPAVDLAMAYLRRKYGMPDSTAAEATLVFELEALQRALAGGKRHLVANRLTYADLAMAVTLQFVSPVDGEHLAIGPATRAAGVHPQLCARYPDIVAWRDALYARHRRVEQPTEPVRE
ncbi:glutathione S-transferase N-terminal domain-containing protein [Myxococcus xanthus]|uniref:Glutathione S-transferase n=1 Tax=Myxococcus xanthus TaxID=34 RepID=A0A7Y4MSK8_MYXXA|nr:glutathione S-transferase N-terminal domain-containing protein [Myxococcus xanthus]NOJ79633.1 glutathione S-transferase [Myxococcus xanthus]NOJ85945.1 glutathione S-transferase [Myxococcus xanthus]